VPTTPIGFDFIDDRPCVRFSADGHQSSESLTCLVDFRCSPGYLLLICSASARRLNFAYVGAFNRIKLMDGSSRVVQAGYLGVDWWNTRTWLRTNELLAAAPSPGIDGYVSLDFFPLRVLEIIVDGRKLNIK